MNKTTLVISLLVSAFLSEAGTLTLADQQKTDYVIVNTSQNEIDRLAAEELSFFLKEATGAEFKITDKAGAKNIYLDPAPEKYSCRICCKGNDLYLSGAGMHGRLNAVYELLETFGFRWFSAYGDSRIPRLSKLTLKTDEICRIYPFKIRSTQTAFYSRVFRSFAKPAAMYHYRNRQNMLLTEFPGVRNEQFEYRPSIHALSSYLHPGVASNLLARQLSWIKNKNYFKDHPEWFPMDAKGKRYPLGQLCFSNPELQAELTRNALGQLEREIARTGRKDGIVSMSINDIVYSELCCCPECRALGRKYGQKGAGAYYKYLFDFCRKIKQLYPQMKVSAFSYLSSISCPEKLEMPDNLILIFCPIYSSYIAPLKEEKNQTTLKILQCWMKGNTEIWYWYYPLPYAEGIYLTCPPISNLRRISHDLITMRDLKIAGTYIEHDSSGRDRSGFFELQSYLLLRLSLNPDDDVDQIVREFTDAYYGKAAPLFREYLNEVEQGCQAAARSGMRAVYNTFNFPYLNPENLSRWSRNFDKMENLTSDDPKAHLHVRLARVAVESAYITVTAPTTDWSQTEQRIAKLEKYLKRICKDSKYPFDFNRLTRWKKALKKKVFKAGKKS